MVLLLFMPNNEVLLGEANGDSDGDDKSTVHGMLSRGRQVKLLEFEIHTLDWEVRDLREDSILYSYSLK